MKGQSSRRWPQVLLLGVLLTVGMAVYAWHRYHTPEAYAERGFALQNQGRYREAIPLFREALRLRPKDAGAHFLLGVALMSANNKLTADSHHQSLIMLNSPSASELQEEIMEYRRAVQLGPGDFQNHYYLASALRNQGDVRGAIAEYRTTIRLLPKTAEALIGPSVARDNAQTLCFAYEGLADMLAADKQYPEAVKQYRQALAWEPDYNYIRLDLAATLNKAGRRDEARTEWQRIVPANDYEAKTAREMLNNNLL